MIINQRWLALKNACADGKAWVKENCKDLEAIRVIQALADGDNWDWANWLIVRVMDRQQYLEYSIFAAEQVIGIYEKKYTENKKPRLAIEAAKKVLESDTEDNRSAASSAAYSAAAYAAAAYASSASAAAAAYAAAASAYAAASADDAADAADDAAYAAASAADDAAYAVRKEMRMRILNYGLDLLRKDKA